jgi:hypothetical protein
MAVLMAMVLLLVADVILRRIGNSLLLFRGIIGVALVKGMDPVFGLTANEPCAEV